MVETDTLFTFEDFVDRLPALDAPLALGCTVHCSYPNTWPTGPYSTELGVVTGFNGRGDAWVDFGCGSVNRPPSWLQVVEAVPHG